MIHDLRTIYTFFFLYIHIFNQLIKNTQYFSSLLHFLSIEKGSFSFLIYRSFQFSFLQICQPCFFVCFIFFFVRLIRNSVRVCNPRYRSVDMLSDYRCSLIDDVSCLFFFIVYFYSFPF